MRRFAAVCAVLFVSVLACKKEDPGSTTGTAKLTSIKYPTDKLPARGSKPITQHAVKGGSGLAAPGAVSKPAYEEDTDRDLRKPATVEKVDCPALPDNVAECDGDNFYFCDDKKLWVVDCANEAKIGGASSGSCFEGENFVDCMGCGTATDGSHVCCDFSQTICCGDDGACYTPK